MEEVKAIAKLSSEDDEAKEQRRTNDRENEPAFSRARAPP